MWCSERYPTRLRHCTKASVVASSAPLKKGLDTVLHGSRAVHQPARGTSVNWQHCYTPPRSLKGVAKRSCRVQNGIQPVRGTAVK